MSKFKFSDNAFIALETQELWETQTIIIKYFYSTSRHRFLSKDAERTIKKSDETQYLTPSRRRDFEESIESGLHVHFTTYNQARSGIAYASKSDARGSNKMTTSGRS